MAVMVQSHHTSLPVITVGGGREDFAPGKHVIPDAQVGYVTSVGGMMHAWRPATIADAVPGDKVLVVRDMGLGDMLLLRPALWALMDKGIDVRLATLARYQSLFGDMPIGVRELAASSATPPAHPDEIVADVRHAVETKGPSRTADRMDLFAYHLHTKLNGHDMRLAVPEKARRAAAEWMESADVPRGSVGVVPEASTRQRTWPHWRELCTALADAQIPAITIGHQENLPSAAIAHAGQPILEAAAVMEQCAVVVTPDTGLLHLAAAVGTPTLALFGSWPGQLRTSHYETCHVIQGHASCAPCFDAQHCEHPRCLASISVAHVLRELGVHHAS